ncbi:unannotated protein [freshwater metagenome]|uniref:Unannotated protein n=1 Tax=freshwater metagenome TaxID=449393 RepID=A0A6J6ZPS8_9ZZZZ
MKSRNVGSLHPAGGLLRAVCNRHARNREARAFHREAHLGPPAARAAVAVAFAKERHLERHGRGVGLRAGGDPRRGAGRQLVLQRLFPFGGVDLGPARGRKMEVRPLRLARAGTVGRRRQDALLVRTSKQRRFVAGAGCIDAMHVHGGLRPVGAVAVQHLRLAVAARAALDQAVVGIIKIDQPDRRNKARANQTALLPLAVRAEAHRVGADALVLDLPEVDVRRLVRGLGHEGHAAENQRSGKLDESFRDHEGHCLFRCCPAPRKFRRGAGRVAQTIFHMAIIPWSSCTTLWQCMG